MWPCGQRVGCCGTGQGMQTAPRLWGREIKKERPLPNRSPYREEGPCTPWFGSWSPDTWESSSPALYVYVGMLPTMPGARGWSIFVGELLSSPRDPMITSHVETTAIHEIQPQWSCCFRTYSIAVWACVRPCTYSQKTLWVKTFTYGN